MEFIKSWLENAEKGLLTVGEVLKELRLPQNYTEVQEEKDFCIITVTEGEIKFYIDQKGDSVLEHTIQNQKYEYRLCSKKRVLLKLVKKTVRLKEGTIESIYGQKEVEVTIRKKKIEIYFSIEEAVYKEKTAKQLLKAKLPGEIRDIYQMVWKKIPYCDGIEVARIVGKQRLQIEGSSLNLLRVYGVKRQGVEVEVMTTNKEGKIEAYIKTNDVELFIEKLKVGVGQKEELEKTMELITSAISTFQRIKEIK